MSRIHDALRRAERLGMSDADPAADILRDPGAAAVLTDVPLPVPDVLPETSADAVSYSAPVAEAQDFTQHVAPAAVMPDSVAIQDEATPLFPGFLDGHFRESNWSAPDSKALLFLNADDTRRLECEQFRTLRSRLYQMRSNRNIRTILVSSALPA